MEIASKTLTSLITNLIPNSGYTYVQSKWIQDELQVLLIFVLYSINRACVLACVAVIALPKKTNRHLAEGKADTLEHIIICLTMVSVVGFIFVTLSFLFSRTDSKSQKRLNNGLFHLFRENGIRPSNEAPPFAL